MNNLVYVLIIGAVSGWLAGQIRSGYGFGLLGNIIVGIVGAFVGNWGFGQLGISLGAGIVGTIITSVIGALVVLFVIGLFKKWRWYGVGRVEFSMRPTPYLTLARLLKMRWIDAPFLTHKTRK